MPGSPPTQRVLDVLELLAGSSAARTASDISHELGLSRSTAGAVLGVLEERDWVRRSPELTYQLGAGAMAFAASAQARGDLPGPGTLAAIEALAAELDCGAALAIVVRSHMVFVAVSTGRGRIPAVITPGARLPYRAPVGATIAAFNDEQSQQQWLRQAATRARMNEYRDVLEQIRTRGVAVWGVAAENAGFLDVLAEVAGHLDDHPATGALRDRVLTMLSDLGGRPYSAATVDSDFDLPISYLTAPVLKADGRAGWELQIGPLRPAVSRAEREHYSARLVATARQLSHNGRT
ncbi:helix-turn-helix domain-containing protein [Nocardia sp. NPDC055321]